MLLRLLVICGSFSLLALSVLATRHGVLRWSLASERIEQQWGTRPDPSQRHVLILGTSLSYQADWVAALGVALADCDLTVEALAKPGANSAWGLEALHDWYQAGGQAGFVVMEFTANDASLAHGLALPHSRKTHQALIALAQSQGAQVALATMSPAWGQNFWERPGQAAYHQMYYELAQAGSVGVIDSVERWSALPQAQRQAYVPDGLHPTQAAGVAITTPVLQTHIATQYCPRSGSPDPQQAEGL